MKQASFLIPVIRGELYLGQRNTPPHEGLWGGIGGKADEGQSLFPQIQITSPNGRKKQSFLEKYRMGIGLENATTTAIREFREECMPEGIAQDFVYIGSVFDEYRGEEVQCSFHLAKVFGTFNLGTKRELNDVSSLRNIEGNQINPITRIALAELKIFWDEFNDLLPHSKYAPFKDCDFSSQIPEFEVPKISSSMVQVEAWRSGSYDY